MFWVFGKNKKKIRKTSRKKVPVAEYINEAYRTIRNGIEGKSKERKPKILSTNKSWKK